MSAGAVVSRSVLSDQVRDRLLERILDGRYAPGARIVETRVARELGTSQAPVREALRDLEALGLVEMEAFRGARVRSPAAAELLEAFSVRAALEAFAADLALERVHDGDLAALRAALDRLEAAAAGRDPLAVAEADAAFHAGLVGLAGNATLTRLWPMLEPPARSFYTFAAPSGTFPGIARMHAPVVDALARRDRTATRAAIDRLFAHLSGMLRPAPASPRERTP